MILKKYLTNQEFVMRIKIERGFQKVWLSI